MRTLILCNMTIESREDNFINATQLCKAGGKSFKDWYRLPFTQELIRELENDLCGSRTGTPPLKLIDETHSEIWIHYDLAVQLAHWIGPLFGIQVSRWINKLCTADTKLEKLLDDLAKLDAKLAAMEKNEVVNQLYS